MILLNEIDMSKNYLSEQISCIENIQKNYLDIIEKIFRLLEDARENKNTIFVMGNGGSASTASHFTSDLLKTSILKNKTRVKAISLSDNIPVMLAWSNDSSYDNIFVGQLENFLQKNDIVIGISGSGNSQNVINAIDFAKKNGAKTISLTGKGGGNLTKISEISFVVPSDDMLTIETMHLLITHLLITMIRKNGEPLFSY